MNKVDGWASGGGVGSDWYSEPLIVNNVIYNNWCKGQNSKAHGGGISCGGDCNAIITNNMIFNNVVYKSGEGGGISCGGYSNVLIKNNTICNNIAEGSGGALYCYESYPVGINNIFWMNTAPKFPEIDGQPTITYSCIQGGYPGTGNTSKDPLLYDPENNDFHLTFHSPCRDRGDNTAVRIPHDFEGDPRVACCGKVDMGADEFYTHLYYTGDSSPGGEVEAKLVGLPETSPTGLWFGLAGVLDPPVQTKYGMWHLNYPWIQVYPLQPIPSNGVLAIPAMLPSYPAPYDIPIQALCGLNSNSLTNLCVLEVR